MSATLLWMVHWICILLILAPLLMIAGWLTLGRHISPWLISRAEAETLADRLMLDNPGAPERAAMLKERAAWRRADPRQQATWRRVRHVLRRRMREDCIAWRKDRPPE